jgi:hypothetical protein
VYQSLAFSHFTHSVHTQKKKKVNFTPDFKTTPFWIPKLQHPPSPKQRHFGHYYYYFKDENRRKKKG